MGRKDGQEESGEGWLRRHAVQLAGMLPPEPADARRVMDLMRVVYEDYMVSAQDREGGSSATVTELRRNRR